jgi:hypothetical protein
VSIQQLRADEAAVVALLADQKVRLLTHGHAVVLVTYPPPLQIEERVPELNRVLFFSWSLTNAPTDAPTDSHTDAPTDTPTDAPTFAY